MNELNLTQRSTAHSAYIPDLDIALLLSLKSNLHFIKSSSRGIRLSPLYSPSSISESFREGSHTIILLLIRGLLWNNRSYQLRTREQVFTLCSILCYWPPRSATANYFEEAASPGLIST